MNDYGCIPSKEDADFVACMEDVLDVYELPYDPMYPVVDTVGKNAKKIQEYIQNQLKEDLEYDQMTLKEYVDPFTGEPVTKNK